MKNKKKKKERPRFVILKIFVFLFLLLWNVLTIDFMVRDTMEELYWNDRLTVPNMCLSDLTDGDYHRMYSTLWLYRETGEETERFWKIADAYDDMFDAITYRRAAELGLKSPIGEDYAGLADDALARINSRADAAEIEQDRLVYEYFAERAAKVGQVE